jgi:hypothetical protein
MTASRNEAICSFVAFTRKTGCVVWDMVVIKVVRQQLFIFQINSSGFCLLVERCRKTQRVKM